MPLPKPNKGEKKDAFLSRCMSEMSGEYEDTSQRYAVCIDCWLKHFAGTIGKFWYKKKLQEQSQFSFAMQELNFAGEKVSMDFDDTLSTARGQELAARLIAKGVNLYIITRRQPNALKEVYAVADKLKIPHSKVIATGGKLKWETIKRIGITKHYDNNPDELDAIRKNVPSVKVVQFDLQEHAAETYNDYPESVKNNAKAVLKYVDENGWGSCGTPVGKARVNQLAKGEAISLDTIKRMYSYLSRHAGDLDSSKGYGDGCGKLMYDSWGGKTALSWAEAKIKSIEKDRS